ncbi:MAG: DNA cytosine methyltransferase [Candidatus Nanopelagicales bacterium]
MSELRAVSLFSGCGGLDLGIRQAGFHVVAGVDNDPRAGRSYRVNFPETAFHAGDIREFDRSLVGGMVGRQSLHDVDLLVGGPPCPPFSKSRFYRTEKPRALADPVGEVTISGYLETLRWLRPRAFLLENVAGMAFDVHRGTLDHILATVTRLGYTCTHRVINAADYGVPQMRQRFILVGMLDSKFTWPVPTHRAPRSGGASAIPEWVTAGHAINDLDTQANAGDRGHVAGGKYHHLLTEIPPGDNYLYFTAKRGHPNPQFEWRKRYWSFLLKLSPDLPSWTIQARRSNNMGPLHWRNRILRIAEVKRLQTFPDQFYLDGTVEQQWRQVGNAVPPLLAATLGSSMREALEAAKPA